ncbi:MAG: hypothetical protein ABI461_03680 [Polyangiaceae bacterium]
MRNLLVVAVAFVALFNAACSGGDRPAQSDDSIVTTNDDTTDDDAGTTASGLSTVCDTEHVGCPCTNEGAVFACGRVKRTSGSYVSCTEGFSTCENGVWGKCMGSNVVAAPGK